VFVSENTDFSSIIEGYDQLFKDSFICLNLEQLCNKWKEAGREFKNSTKDFLNDYKSTIVTPIRIRNCKKIT
jgi:hypothetical protein